MGRIGKVLSFRRVADERGHVDEVSVDIGSASPVTAEVFLPVGIDEQPLEGDDAFLVEGPGSGEWIAVGFRDTKLAGTAGPGELVRFSRSAPGTIAAKIHLKSDGSIDINDGVAVLGADGTLTVPEDVVGGGKSLATHTHGPGNFATPVGTGGGGGAVTGASDPPS